MSKNIFMIVVVPLLFSQCQSEKLSASPTCNTPGPTSGSCTSSTRYYYDTASGQCRSFAFKGCGGNSNNFDTLNTCLNTCVQIRSAICYYPLAIGSCDGVTRYAYDTASGQCRSYVALGWPCSINGSSNNQFDTLSNCRTTCEGAGSVSGIGPCVGGLCPPGNTCVNYQCFTSG